MRKGGGVRGETVSFLSREISSCRVQGSSEVLLIGEPDGMFAVEID